MEWEEFASHLVSRWRADIAKPPEDLAAMRRVAELKRKSSEFSRYWDAHHVQEHRIDIRRLRHPKVGVRAFYRFHLFTAYEGEGAVLYYLPAD